MFYRSSQYFYLNVPVKLKKYVFITSSLSLIFFLIGIPFYLQGCSNQACVYLDIYNALKINTTTKNVICSSDTIFQTQIYTQHSQAYGKTELKQNCYQGLSVFQIEDMTCDIKSQISDNQTIAYYYAQNDFINNTFYKLIITPDGCFLVDSLYTLMLIGIFFLVISLFFIILLFATLIWIIMLNRTHAIQNYNNLNYQQHQYSY